MTDKSFHDTQRQLLTDQIDKWVAGLSKPANMDVKADRKALADHIYDNFYHGQVERERRLAGWLRLLANPSSYHRAEHAISVQVIDLAKAARAEYEKVTP